MKDALRYVICPPPLKNQNVIDPKFIERTTQYVRRALHLSKNKVLHNHCFVLGVIQSDQISCVKSFRIVNPIKVIIHVHK